MSLKFYECEHCGNIISYVKDTGVPVMCCGTKMKEIIAGTTDAAKEKHIPVVSVDGGKVTVDVGSVSHPMSAEHLIEWVAVETKTGYEIKYLTPDSEPKVCFSLCEGDEVVSVYAYCNLHGLWKA